MRFKVEMTIESETWHSAKSLVDAIERVLQESWDWTEVKEVKATMVIPT
jgi:hypothetical protein